MKYQSAMPLANLSFAIFNILYFARNQSICPRSVLSPIRKGSFYRFLIYLTIFGWRLTEWHI